MFFTQYYSKTNFQVGVFSLEAEPEQITQSNQMFYFFSHCVSPFILVFLLFPLLFSLSWINFHPLLPNCPQSISSLISSLLPVSSYPSASSVHKDMTLRGANMYNLFYFYFSPGIALDIWSVSLDSLRIVVTLAFLITSTTSMLLSCTSCVTSGLVAQFSLL